MFPFLIYLECFKAQQFAQLASKQQVSNVSLWRLVTIQFNCELGFCDNLMINSAIKQFQHSPGPSQIKFNESGPKWGVEPRCDVTTAGPRNMLSAHPILWKLFATNLLPQSLAILYKAILSNTLFVKSRLKREKWKQNV